VEFAFDHNTQETSKLVRRKVNSASDIEIEPIRRSSRSVRKSSDIKYLKKMKRKSSSSLLTNMSWVKAGWIFCAILGLRLVFMERGVIDYYQTLSNFEVQEHELSLIKKENQEIMSEINLIQKSSVYQKQIAREHLGVIAKDEYIILFAKDAGKNSI
jgi:cell division protein FtsB